MSDTSELTVTPAISAVPALDSSAEYRPTDAKRLRSFANFVKNYMSVSAALAAAAPIPVALFELTPAEGGLDEHGGTSVG
jgi:hypothetical protein